MGKKIILDQYEQDVENNIEQQHNLVNLSNEMKILNKAASHHTSRKKSITLRVHEQDLEAIRIKASKIGVPYQTYLNMIIHRDASIL